MRNGLLTFGLVVVFGAVRVSAQTPLANQVQTVLTDARVSRAHWGISVTTLEGAAIYGLNDAQLFRPASNAKLYTTAAALAVLGAESTVTTQIVARGEVASDHAGLQGDLVLVGAGDANLSARMLPYVSAKDRLKSGLPATVPLHYVEAMANAIAASGLKMVSGDVVGDDTEFPYEPYAPDWSIDDAVWGYGAPVSALTVIDNQMTMTIKPAKAAGERPSITVDPGSPAYYTVDSTGLITGEARSGNHVQIARQIGSRDLRVYGILGTDALPETEEIAIQDPAEFAAIALKEALEARGVAVRGTARAQHRLPSEAASFLSVSTRAAGKGCTSSTSEPAEKVLAERRSVPLAEDVVLTNKVSQNLHAELLLHRLGQKVSCDASTAGGAAAVRGFLTQSVGISGDDFVFYDGSGLSGHDLVTPRATVKLLAYAATQPWFAVYKESLPVGGEDGSLMTRFPTLPLKGNVRAKTGTLGESRVLSGYVTAASGKTIIFSIMVDNHTPRTTADRDAMDRIVQIVAASN